MIHRGGGETRILKDGPSLICIFMIKFNAKDKNGDKIAEARRHSERHGDGFAGPGGYSANL